MWSNCPAIFIQQLLIFDTTSINSVTYDKVKVLAIRFCLTLCNSMDCIVHQASLSTEFHARILERVATPFLQGIFPTQGSNIRIFCIVGRFFTLWATREALVTNTIWYKRLAFLSEPAWCKFKVGFSVQK